MHSKTETLKNLAINALEDMKAQDITILDVTDKCNFTDVMIVATATSSRHASACANNVHVECKEAGNRPLGTEGKDTGEWVLVDLGDVIVHVMQQAARDLYQVEKLWEFEPNRDTDSSDDDQAEA